MMQIYTTILTMHNKYSQIIINLPQTLIVVAGEYGSVQTTPEDAEREQSITRIVEH